MKLLLGGSPCTHWSIAQTKNRETKPEGLGWELFKNYLIARDKFKPDYFLYENNKSMAPAIREQITKELGVEPVMINSALVSAQNRQRLYWTNIPGVEQPEDKGILLRDILESGVCWREKGYALLSATGGPTAEDMIARRQRNGTAEPLSEREMEYMVREIKDGKNHFDFDYYHDATKDKSSCVTANTHRGVPYNVLTEPVNITADGKAHCLRGTCDKDGIRNMVGNTVDRKTCVAEPIRIGTIESDTDHPENDSQQYRVYSPDSKSVTLCGNGGGVGAKTGLYATPVRVGDMPNADGIIRGGQAHRVYDADGKGTTLTARSNGGGVDGPLYAVRTPIEYNPLQSCDVAVTDQNIRCTYKDRSGTAQGYTVYFDDVKGPSVIAGHAHKIKIIEPVTGKEWPVYEVRDGQITIKDKQYPIKLADGFYIIRKLTVRECMRLQTVPEDYIFPVSNTQAYKMLGNGWTVDVIAHILSFCPGITKEPLTVLSMYDGMSCGHLALNKLGAHVKRYYATEIDKYAIKTTQTNFPDTVQMGDAFQVRNVAWNIF